MTTPNREIELKFLLDAAAAQAVLAALPPGETVVKDLVAIYYDTADHALSRAGFGLRVRRSAGKRVQTLKSALGEDGGRDEWDWPVTTDEPDLALLATTPAPVSPDTVLTPQFTVRSRRTIRLVQEGGGAIELVIDDAEVSAGNRRDAFLELELELMSGDPADLARLAERLSRVATLTPSSVTKAERGFALLR
ncbi:CYTH domain-containing protein [Caulobacter mirabilis]|nr:CYTH domain-containing protein [Caulobacter mirabilis]